jgi:hypothetical protein
MRGKKNVKITTLPEAGPHLPPDIIFHPEISHRIDPPSIHVKKNRKERPR